MNAVVPDRGRAQEQVAVDPVKASTVVFTFSAVLQTFHEAYLIWGGAIALLLILTAFLRDTGAAPRPAPIAAPAPSP